MSRNIIKNVLKDGIVKNVLLMKEVNFIELYNVENFEIAHLGLNENGILYLYLYQPKNDSITITGSFEDIVSFLEDNNLNGLYTRLALELTNTFRRKVMRL